jgi:hypothetical protein
MTQGNLFDETPDDAAGPAVAHVRKVLSERAVLNRLPLAFKRIVSATEPDAECCAVAEVVMFDDMPGTIEIFPNGKLGKNVYWGAYWSHLPGGDIEFARGCWQRVV